MAGLRKQNFKSAVYFARKCQFWGTSISQHAFDRRNERGAFNPVILGKVTFAQILVELSNIRYWHFCKSRGVAIGKSGDGYYFLSEDLKRVITFVVWDQPEFQLQKLKAA